MQFPISDLEQDILRETMNLALSKAADSISRLLYTQQRITISVPEVKLLSPEEFHRELPDYKGVQLLLMTRVQGDLAGVSLLLFPEAEMEWLLNHILSEREQLRSDAPALRASLLLEISNILTGSILTQFANLLGVEAIGQLPERIVPPEGTLRATLLEALPQLGPSVLAVTTDIRDENQIVSLPLLLVLEAESVERLMRIIRQAGAEESRLLVLEH